MHSTRRRELSGDAFVRNCATGASRDGATLVGRGCETISQIDGSACQGVPQLPLRRATPKFASVLKSFLHGVGIPVSVKHNTAGTTKVDPKRRGKWTRLHQLLNESAGEFFGTSASASRVCERSRFRELIRERYPRPHDHCARRRSTGALEANYTREPPKRQLVAGVEETNGRAPRAARTPCVRTAVTRRAQLRPPLRRSRDESSQFRLH